VTDVDARTRLCPHCANGIPQDVVQCPYCRVELGSAQAPQWPKQESVETKSSSEATKTRPFSKAILIVGIVVFALGVFLIGERTERGESQQVLQEKINELHQKNLQIQSLEMQLRESRTDLSNNAKALAEMRTALEVSRKEITVTRERLIAANREVDRLSTVRAPSFPRPPQRSVDAAPPPAPPVRRAAEPGLYETIRPTAVYADPQGSSRVVAQIAKGTKVSVVGSVGDWLEVRSKHGNPPGFVRRDDAMFVGRAN